MVVVRLSHNMLYTTLNKAYLILYYLILSYHCEPSSRKDSLTGLIVSTMPCSPGGNMNMSPCMHRRHGECWLCVHYFMCCGEIPNLWQLINIQWQIVCYIIDLFTRGLMFEHWILFNCFVLLRLFEAHGWLDLWCHNCRHYRRSFRWILHHIDAIPICHLVHIHSAKTGILFSLLLCSLWWVQIDGYVLACRSCLFVCTLHHLIIIIGKLIWRHWTYKMPVRYILSIVWVRFKHIFSVIHYTIYGAVCFRFTHFPCDDWENIHFVLISSSNRKYEILAIV